ncbi:auxin-responsive protein IAA33 [Argentina anserina]|uniref:auxin-responsive protein IAA33 n=1 Tax=Argentina anserina TaxID=57926 RepID=UPI0021762F19|nr:auxin-responsive protein IAA33 [Potentilla anserina]
MNFFQSQRQDSLKRRWQEIKRSSATTPPSTDIIRNPNCALNVFPGLLGEDDLVSMLVPPVTVVLEGRSICQRISLQNHTSYQSLAKALQQMFVDGGDVGATAAEIDSKDLNLSNAIPGHVIAYEDMENDLLLAGDLNWKDFVRVAKRIRILPAKVNSRRGGRRST